MLNKTISLTIMFLVILARSIFAYDENSWEISAESGLVLPGYNDVQSPNNDTATRFSLSDTLDIASSGYIRMKLGYNFSERHHITLLYAPLSLDAQGVLTSDVVFEGTLFAANSSIKAKYRFDSYRMSYRYDLVKNQNLSFGIGFTAKIRDAEIALESNTQSTSKTNTGFVPLLNLFLKWRFSEDFGLQIEADALAAKQGRAEDVNVALFYEINRSMEFKVGYRIVEGGANVDEVYNFALINYLTAALTIRF